MFYDSEALRKKALKLYEKGDIFRDYMDEGELFPLKIKLKKVQQRDIQNSFLAITHEIKSLQKESFTLLYERFLFKNVGEQKLPVAIVYEMRQTLLESIGKVEEFGQFVEIYQKTKSYNEGVLTLLYQKPFLFLENQLILENIFLVCTFFMQNPKPNIYLRELSIAGVDTKFVENNKKIIDLFLRELLHEDSYNKEQTKLSNYGFEKKYNLLYPLPQVRFRILDNNHALCGMSDITLTVEEFKKVTLQIKKVFIVENKMTMLSFPTMEDSIVIFGSGYGVEVLKDVSWLKEKELYYWGDIDSDGFAILSQIRGYFKDIRSLFMDKKTIDAFVVYSVTCKEELKTLKHLSDAEESIYGSLQNGFRLEQEKIFMSYVKEKIYDYIV